MERVPLALGEVGEGRAQRATRPGCGGRNRTRAVECFDRVLGDRRSALGGRPCDLHTSGHIGHCGDRRRTGGCHQPSAARGLGCTGIIRRAHIEIEGRVQRQARHIALQRAFTSCCASGLVVGRRGAVGVGSDGIAINIHRQGVVLVDRRPTVVGRGPRHRRCNGGHLIIAELAAIGVCRRRRPWCIRHRSRSHRDQCGFGTFDIFIINGVAEIRTWVLPTRGHAHRVLHTVHKVIASAAVNVRRHRARLCITGLMLTDLHETIGRKSAIEHAHHIAVDLPTRGNSCLPGRIRGFRPR